MAAVTLSPGMQLVAAKIQEAAMMHGDVRKSLQDAINDHKNDKGGAHWSDELIDHDGDGTEGNCVYSCKGNIQQAPYEMGALAGKAPTASIDFKNSKNVLPVTQYLPEPEDEDHYTAMGEAFREAKLYTELPLYERFIAKKTRDAADNSDFAGKGRSFPILKKADVAAAKHSIGRAGPDNYSHATISANIDKIAKRKGFADDKDESVPRVTPAGIRLVEAAAFAEGTQFKEASAANPLVKIISPGRGSSGFYTKEMLQRDGPKVFKRGTLMYINHATPAEEAQRPEGDWSKLAAVTEGDAYWDDNGKGGAALYAPAKIFSEYATQVAEKAPYTGVSIRATGHYESASGRIGPEVKLDESKMAPDGKPGLIGALTEADSIDLVTKAGRDGKLFLESAREGEHDMEKAAVEALIKESMAPVMAENARLRETISRQGAPQAIAEALREIRLPGPLHVVEATRTRIIKSLSPHVPLDEHGKFDAKKLGEMVEAEALHEAQYLAQMGFGGPDVASIGKRMTEAEITAANQKDGKHFEEALETGLEALADIFVGKKYAKGSCEESARQNRKAARKAFIEGRAA